MVELQEYTREEKLATGSWAQDHGDAGWYMHYIEQDTERRGAFLGWDRSDAEEEWDRIANA